MIESGREDEQKVVEKKRFVVQIKLDRFVVQFDVGHFGDDVLGERQTEMREGGERYGVGEGDGIEVVFILLSLSASS